jgi:hypothetical protein
LTAVHDTTCKTIHVSIQKTTATGCNKYMHSDATEIQMQMQQCRCGDPDAVIQMQMR